LAAPAAARARRRFTAASMVANSRLKRLVIVCGSGWLATIILTG
jgi:hypothetical protein